MFTPCCDNCEKGSTCKSVQKKNMSVRDGIVYKGLVDPEKFSNVQFPMPYSRMPAFPCSKVGEINLTTNAAGAIFFQFNFGIYYLASQFAACRTSTGNMPVGICVTNTPTSIAAVQWDGLFQIPDNTGVAVTGTNATTLSASNLIGNDINAETLSLFSSIRAGPGLIKFEYIGGIDDCQGNITCGISYTRGTTNTDSAIPNSLCPDLVYSNIKLTRDLPGAISCPITKVVEARFLPHSFESINFKQTSAGPLDIVQRFSLVVTGAKPSTTIGRIKIISNFFGNPNSGLAEIVKPTVDTCYIPNESEFSSAVDALTEDGLVIGCKKSTEYNAFGYLQG